TYFVQIRGNQTNKTLLPIRVTGTTNLGSYTLSVVTAPLTVPPGTTSASDVVMLTRSSFTDAVTLTGTADDAGITVNITSQPGTSHPGTLTGVAAGLQPVVTTFSVVVTAATQGYTVSAPTLNVNLGAAQPNTVTIARTNFATGITISATSDDPTNVTVTANPST